MDDPPEAEYRTHFSPPPDAVRLKTSDQGAPEGMMSIRMPVASTGTVRNEGDDPLTRAELEGMAQQINRRNIGVFPDHGMNTDTAGDRYSQLEKMGYWEDGEVDRNAASDGEDLLMASAVMPDPETLPPATKGYRQALAVYKEQAKRGVPMDASIGWRTDEEMPGGNDLMEISIVGIGADPRTNVGPNGNAQAVARAAIQAGADPERLVNAVRDAVSDTRPFGPPSDPERWDSFDECVADVSDWDGIDDPEAYCGAVKSEMEQSAVTTALNECRDHSRATYEVEGVEIDITPPEAMVNAAEAALAAKDEYDLTECGTGVGEDRARQIIRDEVGPDVVDEIAAYLTSHEEDVDGITDPPTDWGEAEWTGTYNSDETRCGPVQYALWGGTATGTALDWAQGKANEVAEALGEELPYDRDMTDDDTPEDGGTTDEQTAEAGDETRAPDDVTENQLLTFVATHYDGADESDLADAMDAADAEYVGAADVEALADLVSTVTGAEYETVMDAMGDLMETQGEVDDDEEEDEEDEEMEQSADTDTDAGGAEDADADPAAEVERLAAELEEVRQALRDGDAEVERPGTGDTDDAETREADADDADADESTADTTTSFTPYTT